MTTTPPVTSTPTPTPTTTSGTSSTGTLDFTQNFDTFLTLLTTQLKNQDPLSPMDTSQFTDQLVMFSQVEQQIKTNSQLSTMISQQSASQMISALPMVGRMIEYNGNQTVLQNGQAGFSYTLPSDAASATVAVQDPSGNTIFSQKVDGTAGKHAFIWDGKNSSGAQQPDGGTYQIKVLAADTQNQPITATTTAVGTVTGVNVTNNVATFDVSGVHVPMSQLVTVINPSSTTASN